MRDIDESSSSLTAIRTMLAQAMEYLIARHGCSPVEARERIEREAVAKRASLNDVAQAIVVGETVSYRQVCPLGVSSLVRPVLHSCVQSRQDRGVPHQ